MSNYLLRARRAIKTIVCRDDQFCGTNILTMAVTSDEHKVEKRRTQPAGMEELQYSLKQSTDVCQRIFQGDRRVLTLKSPIAHNDNGLVPMLKVMQTYSKHILKKGQNSVS